MNLSLLAGNAALKGQLEAQTARRGLSHAYILSGPAGVGKRTLARVLAAAFVCRGQGDKPCLSCLDCRKAMERIHPDISVIGDDGRDISVARSGPSGPTPISAPTRPGARCTFWKMPRP